MKTTSNNELGVHFHKNKTDKTEGAIIIQPEDPRFYDILAKFSCTHPEKCNYKFCIYGKSTCNYLRMENVSDPLRR